MAEDIIEEVATGSGNAPARTGSFGGRRVIEEVIDDRADRGSRLIGKRERPAGTDEEIIDSNGRKPKVYKESTQKLLDAIDAENRERAGLEDREVESGDPDDAGLVEPEVGEQVAAAGETVVETTPPEVETLRTDHARVSEANRKLLDELETLKRTPKVPERGERESLLDEADREYFDGDNITAVRKFLGAVLGAKHDSKEVDAELAGLFTDLTSRELGAPLDPSVKASRDAARVMQMRARDRREQKAATEAKSPATSDDGAADTHWVGITESTLGTKSVEGRSIADEFPMLMTLAEDLDGMKPAALVYKVIRRELQAGTLDPKTDNATLVRQASKLIENHYHAIGERFAKAKPVSKPDTAQPAGGETANAVKKSEASRQPAAARITNASASVAPATPPKKQAAVEPKKFKSEKERKEFLLRKHFPEG